MVRKMVLCAVLLTPVLALGQTGVSATGGYRPRSSYDPGAALSNGRQQQSGVSAALQKINPRNTDYGQVIDQVKIAAIEETLDNFFWRSSMVLTVILMFAVLYIMWLLRQREVRINISSDIVAQLYNGHVASRAKALEAIDLHNKLVRRYNAQSVELTKLREASAQKESAAESKDGIEGAEIFHAQRSKLGADLPAEGTSSAVASPDSTPDAVEGEEEEEVATGDAEQLREQLRQSNAQIKAGEQKISNLRTQLARAHHSLEDARGKTPNRRPA